MTELIASRYLVRLIDDDEELLDALGFAIGLHGWKVRNYRSAEQFLEQGDFVSPGCIILDMRMPGKSGSELHEILREDGCPLPVIFLTGHGDMQMAIHAFRGGAYDFLLKPVDPDELMQTIRKAIEKFEEQMRERRRSSPLSRYQTLTDREKVVLEDLQANLSSKEIAEHLGGSSRTIQRHRQNVMKKLGLTRTEEIRDFLQKVRVEQEALLSG